MNCKLWKLQQRENWHVLSINMYNKAFQIFQQIPQKKKHNNRSLWGDNRLISPPPKQTRNPKAMIRLQHVAEQQTWTTPTSNRGIDWVLKRVQTQTECSNEIKHHFLASSKASLFVLDTHCGRLFFFFSEAGNRAAWHHTPIARA